MGFESSTFPCKEMAFFGAKHATYAATGSTSMCIYSNGYKLVYINFVTQMRYS